MKSHLTLVLSLVVIGGCGQPADPASAPAAGAQTQPDPPAPGPNTSTSTSTAAQAPAATIEAPVVESEGKLVATLDLRAGRIFNLSGQRFEVSMDVYNVTNANTTYSVRTGTGTTNVRYANDPNQPTTPIATFMSPTGVLGPRIIRFNLTYWFGTGTSAAGRR